MGASHYVFKNRHLFKEADILERAREPQADHPMRRHPSQRDSVKADAARCCAVESRHAIKERSLAGTVRPDEAVNRTRVKAERHVRQDSKTPDLQRDMFNFKD